MVGCGQNSVTTAPDAGIGGTTGSTAPLQTIVKGLGPDPVNTSPVKFMSDSGNGLISALGDGGMCKPGWFCMWEDNNYNGNAIGFIPNVANVGSYWNDRATSFWNRTGKTVCVWTDTWYRGQGFGLGAGAWTWNIGSNTTQHDFMGGQFGNMNDTVSSISNC